MGKIKGQGSRKVRNLGCLFGCSIEWEASWFKESPKGQCKIMIQYITGGGSICLWPEWFPAPLPQPRIPRAEVGLDAGEAKRAWGAKQRWPTAWKNGQELKIIELKCIKEWLISHIKKKKKASYEGDTEVEWTSQTERWTFHREMILRVGPTVFKVKTEPWFLWL